MSNARADALIDKNKSYMYDEITEDLDSVFRSRTKTHVFVTAASIGYYFKKSTPLPTSKQSLFVSTTLGDDSRYLLWIMKSIAISQVGIEVLKNMRDVMKICQEYANYGIDYLYNLHKESDNEIAEVVRLMMAALGESEEYVFE